jgi:beta-glucosidase
LGENARNPLSTGGGSAGVLSPYTVSLLEGLEARFGKERVCFGEIPEDADAVIVSVGVHSGEGSDRKSLELAEEDVATIKEAAEACRQQGKKSVVVLNVCGPVEVYEWIDDVDAVLLIWLGGMELGHAAAALLSGDENPCGKLPLTFPRRYRDTPACLNFPGEFGRVLYGEGIYVGYRYYDIKGIAPQFPFGFGLSYTTFELGNLRLSSETLNLDEDDAVVVSVDVTNVGERGGKQVVQLYVSDVASTPHKPLKELKAFQKVYVGAGETQTVQFAVTRRSVEHYDPNREAWCVEPGTFRVLIGTSAQDISLSGAFRAVGFNPYGYGPETAIEKVMSDERAVAVLQKHLPAEVASPQAMAMVLQYNPHWPLDKIWTEWFDRALGDRSEEEKAAIRREAYQDLAKVEIWD